MPPPLQQSVDLPTLVAGLALLTAILSAFPALLVRRNRWRVASRFRWLAFLLLAIAGACFPAPDWLYRLMNGLMGLGVVCGGLLPLFGGALTVRFLRQTVAESRGHDPLELLLSSGFAFVLFCAGVVAVFAPANWLIDHSPKWAAPLLPHALWFLFAFALIFLLAARGTVAIMARIITAVVFLLILGAGEAGLLWALRSFAHDRFLAVCSLAVAVGFAGWVRTTDLSEWGYAPDPS